MTRRRGVLWLIAGLALVYAVYAIVMVQLHPRFIYPLHPDVFRGEGYSEVTLDVPGAAPLPLQVVRGAAGAPVVVYFMGNVGALEFFRAMLDHHKAAGRSVVAMPYRGGGGVPGTVSETSLKRDALALMDALPDFVPEGPVIVQGFSLGTGIATYVAANRAVDGMILGAPYARMCELMAKASYLPACILPGIQRWDSLRAAQNVRVPVAVFHGDKDALIPIRHGERMAAAFSVAGADAAFHEVSGAAHNDLIEFPGYLEKIDAFIDRFAND